MSAPSPEVPGARRSSAYGGRMGRVAFRWCRISILLLVFLGILLGLFLNHVGLPVSVQERLSDRVRQQGWDVEFSRLRLRWYRGLVADHVHIHQAGKPNGPQLFIEEAEGRLDFRSLWKLRLNVTALALRNGRLLVPLGSTNRPRQTIGLNDLYGEVRFRAGDLWDLPDARATCLGAKLQLSGLVTNASALRDWRLPRLTTATSETERAGRADLWRTLRSVRFTRAPQITAQFSADARDTNSVSVRFRLTAPDVTSPWGRGANFQTRVQLTPPRRPAEPFQIAWHLRAEALRTPWGQAGQLEADADFEPPPGMQFPTNLALTLKLSAPDTPWGRADRVAFEAQIAPRAGDAPPRATAWNVRAEGLQTPWAKAARVQARGHLFHPATNYLPADFRLDAEAVSLETTNGHVGLASAQATGWLPPADQLLLLRTNLTWPERAQNIPVNLALRLTNVTRVPLPLQRLSVTGDWHAPYFTADVDAALEDRASTGSAQVALNTATRDLQLSVDSRLDPHRIGHLFPTNVQAALRGWSWDAPPHVEADARLRLPAWDRPATNGWAEVLPSLSLRGRLDFGAGAHQGLAFTSVRSEFVYSNDVLRLPALSVVRAEGALNGAFSAQLPTHDFEARLASTLDPHLIKSWLPTENARKLLDEFRLTAPPSISAEVSGNWRDWTRLDVQADFAATNFVFRGEPIQDCVTGVRFTNQFLGFLNPVIRREGEVGRADGVGVDLGAQLVHLTNAAGNLSAYAIARVIGPHVVRALEPYVFDHSPTGRAWGVIDMLARGHRDNVHFELSGGPFRWRQFHLPHIAGQVDWVGQTVAITNLQGAFYDGRIAGHIRVDFAPTNGEVFAFHTLITNVSLPKLVADVGGKTNQLDGRLNGDLTVFYAHTADPLSWQGHGHLDLTNGLLWDIPIFGIFSPVFNAFVPGLGNSRARRASATLAIANSVIHSRDLQIDATAMRMQYDLRVDFEQRIEGRVEAELLRNLPGVGLVLSKVLWPVTKLFEYRLSGTLNQPKASPVFFIPRILLLPFRPIKTIEELLPESPRKEAPPKP